MSDTEHRAPSAFAFWVALGLPLLASCAGHVRGKGEAKNATAASAEDDRRWEPVEPSDEPLATMEDEDEPHPARKSRVLIAAVKKPPADGATVDPPTRSDDPAHFFGVSHELSLAADPSARAVCSCLAVAQGRASDRAFAWEGPPPAVAPDALVVAVGAAPCPAIAGGRPVDPSIAGLEREGADVVVLVENARLGAPVARGAVVKPPGPGGALVIRSVNTPIGRSLDGSTASCRIPASR